MNCRLKSLCRLLLMTFLISTAAFAIDYGEALTDPVLERRAKHLYAQIRCPTCVGQSIEGSSSQMAYDLRTDIRQQLLAGATDEVIIKDLQNRYGAAITYDPGISAQTWLLWGLPLVLIIVGALVLITRYGQAKHRSYK